MNGTPEGSPVGVPGALWWRRVPPQVRGGVSNLAEKRGERVLLLGGDGAFVCDSAGELTKFPLRQDE